MLASIALKAASRSSAVAIAGSGIAVGSGGLVAVGGASVGSGASVTTGGASVVGAAVVQAPRSMLNRISVDKIRVSPLFIVV
jgi:hypothetical protein